MFAVRRYGQLLLVLTLVFGALAIVATHPAPSHAAGGCTDTYTLDKTERLKFTDLDGASGMVASRSMEGVFWVNNDRAGAEPNTVFAIDADGYELARITFVLSGGNPTVPGDFVDLEDIAIGPGPDTTADYLYIADTGDNDRNRSEVAVYRFEEPQFDPGGATDEIFISESELDGQRFTYQQFADPNKTQARDAEGIFVDPEGGDLYIFEKGTHSLTQLGEGLGTEPLYSLVYMIPRPKLFYGGSLRTANIVTYIQHRYGNQSSGEGAKITAADISHDGRLIVVRNGESSFYWERARGQTIGNVFEMDHSAPCMGPDDTRGESVAILADGSGYYGLRESADPNLMSPIFKAEIVGYGLPRCNGVEATHPDHVGTPGNDVITGTDGNDVIVAFGGNDVIDAGKGADLICAGSGNDVVTGGGGNDIIFGRAGRDQLDGGFGQDAIYGGIHADVIRAGWGNDLAAGGEHGDTVHGNKGTDTVRGDRGNDTVTGGGSNDLVKGNVGDDSLFGGPGFDTCDGGGGTDSASATCEQDPNVP